MDKYWQEVFNWVRMLQRFSISFRYKYAAYCVFVWRGIMWRGRMKMGSVSHWTWWAWQRTAIWISQLRKQTSGGAKIQWNILKPHWPLNKLRRINKLLSLLLLLFFFLLVYCLKAQPMERWFSRRAAKPFYCHWLSEFCLLS